MKQFLTILAVALIGSCFAESAQAQQCGYGGGFGGGYYAARPVVAVGYVPVSRGYGYGGYPAVRSSSFYRGPSYGGYGVNYGSRYVGPSLYRGGGGYGGRYGGFGGGYGGRYGGYGGRGVSIRLGF